MSRFQTPPREKAQRAQADPVGAASAVARWRILQTIPDTVYESIRGFEGLTIYHTKPWHRFLARTFGWPVRALVGYTDQDSVGFFLPFVSKRRPVALRRVNICLPASHRVGPLWRDEAARGGACALFQQLAPFEIHDGFEMSGLARRPARFLTVIDLSKHQDLSSLRKSFQESSIRRKIRAAEKSGLKVVEGTEETHFDHFRSLQAETRHRQGSPMYPRAFFRNMREELRGLDQIHLYLIYDGGRAVSGIVFLHFGDTATYGYGASVTDRALWRKGVNQLAMWAAIRDAYEKGLKTVDLGVTAFGQPDLKKYKEKWGGTTRLLDYTVSETGRPAQVERDSPPAALASRLLRIMPGWLFERVSPVVFRMVV